jgi:hypothetical protein
MALQNYRSVILVSSRALRQAQGRLRCPAKIAETLSEARQREVERGGISQSKHGSHKLISVINEPMRDPSLRLG